MSYRTAAHLIASVIAALYFKLQGTLKYFCKHSVVEISKMEEEITSVKTYFAVLLRGGVSRLKTISYETLIFVGFLSATRSMNLRLDPHNIFSFCKRPWHLLCDRDLGNS